MAVPDPFSLKTDTPIAGKYWITREIGRGGMAAVYEAENTNIGKRIAIKILAQELTTSSIVVERFLREARAAAAIRSPYICDVYDSGRLDDGRPFLVLELLEGESVYERMSKVRAFDIGTTVTIITQVCRGLTKAHGSSIVHRDLKPENIFITKDEDGQLLAKILDFGLAKFYAPAGPSEKKQVRLTREGAVFGTPAYMSPEQIRGQGAVDHRADLWALGCIVYECLTGRTVWQTDQGVAMTFAQIASGRPPNPKALRPDLPESFVSWFKKSLHRDINQRFQTAREFAEALAASFETNVGAHAPDRDLETVEPHIRLGHANFADEATTRRFAPEAATSPGLSQFPKSIPSPALALSGRDPDTEVPVFVSEPPAKKISSNPPSLGAHRAKGGPEEPMSVPPFVRAKRASVRRAWLALGVTLCAGLAYAEWGQLLQSTATVLSAARWLERSKAIKPPTATIADSAAPVVSEPWGALVQKGQQALAAGNLVSAAHFFKEAHDDGGQGMPKALLEQLQVASHPQADAPCRLTGLGRPRTYDLHPGSTKSAPGGRPTIAVSGRGPVVTWTDAHEGSQHAYTVLLNETLQPVSGALDVTPEAASVGKAELSSVGDKLVLTYTDLHGHEAALFVRAIDANGRIAGPAVPIGATKGGTATTSTARAPDGNVVVAWVQDGLSPEKDIYLRRLTRSLDPIDPAVPITDILPLATAKPRLRSPSISVRGDILHVAFALDKEHEDRVLHMQTSLVEASRGLGPPLMGAPRVDRILGETYPVGSERSSYSTMACGPAGCFIVWQSEEGLSAAFVEGTKSQPLWSKRFSKSGEHPSLAIAASGKGQLVWVDGGRVRTAPIGTDGIGVAAEIGKCSAEQPPPAIHAGTKAGDWYLVWLDYESSRLEPFAARINCR